jgi:hypothetical protein
MRFKRRLEHRNANHDRVKPRQHRDEYVEDGGNDGESVTARGGKA